MIQEPTILELDAATMEAWFAQLADLIARGDIRMVVRDGIAVACYMPGAGHPAQPRPIAPDMANALLAEALARITATPPDGD